MVPRLSINKIKSSAPGPKNLVLSPPQAPSVVGQNQSDIIAVKKAFKLNKSVIDEATKAKKFKIARDRSGVSNSVCLPCNLKVKRAASAVGMKKKFVVKTP